MSYYVNGHCIPEVATSPGLCGGAKEKSRSERIADFIKEELPGMCKRSVSEDSAVINLSVSLYYGVDAVFTEQKINDSLLTSSQARGVTHRRRLYVSHNYLALRQGEKWQIEPLLLQDEWLSRDKVHKAFEKIVKAKKWSDSIEVPLLLECVVDNQETIAWGARVNAGEEWHTLVCLPQNGLILIDRTEDEFPISSDARIDVADCYFRPYISKGEIISLMQV